MFQELMDALGYASSSLDKLGPRPLRGLMAGRPREALSILPFSDTLGITDPRDVRSGRDVLDYHGLTNPSDQGWGAWGAGLAADVALDPLLLAGGARLGLKGLSKAMMPSTTNPVHHLAGLLGDAGAATRATTHLNPMESALYRRGRTKGALGLPFDAMERPPGMLPRHDPEWVNQKTWYHGSGTPGLTGEMLDPMKTAPENLFGRGIYTTANPDLARSYLGKGVGVASDTMESHLRSPALADVLHERAAAGELDPYLREHRGSVIAELGLWPGEDLTQWAPNEKANLLMKLARRHGRAASQTADPLMEFEPGMEEAFQLVAPGFRPPKPTLYQAQGQFGNVLDLNRRMPTEDYGRLLDALRTSSLDAANKTLISPVVRAGEVSRIDDAVAGLRQGRGRTPDQAIAALKGWNTYDKTDPLVAGLRQAGYDALTHTGGMMAGRGSDVLHQVLIALDPNNVMNIGKPSPFKRWEPYQGVMGAY